MRDRLAAAAFSVLFHAVPILVLPAWKAAEPGVGRPDLEFRVVGLLDLAGEQACEVAPVPASRVPAVKQIAEDLQVPERPVLPDAVLVPAVMKKASSRHEDAPSPQDPEPSPDPPAPEPPREKVSASPGARVSSGDPEPGGGEIDDLRRRYLTAVLRKVHAAKRYPARARWRGQEGRAIVVFTINADGTVSRVALERGTSFPLLDREATSMVRRAAPFEPIPPGVGKDHWTLRVPIRFHLARRR